MRLRNFAQLTFPTNMGTLKGVDVVDKALRSDLETTCQRLGLPVVNVLDPVMNLLQDYIGEQAGSRPGKPVTWMSPGRTG